MPMDAIPISDIVSGPDAGSIDQEPTERAVDALPSTPPSTPVVVDMPEEVLRVPVYLELARHNSVQVNMLVEVVLAMSADGKFVQATATCDEVNPPFPRVGVSRHLSLTTDASIYVPSNIMYAPVYVVVRRIRGLILQTRIAIQLTFIEWLPGDRSTFEVIADIKLLTEGVMAATRCLYVGDAYAL